MFCGKSSGLAPQTSMLRCRPEYRTKVVCHRAESVITARSDSVTPIHRRWSRTLLSLHTIIGKISSSGMHPDLHEMHL
jgi:hypothetical protein